MHIKSKTPQKHAKFEYFGCLRVVGGYPWIICG
jgi:hypothetical protein